MTSEHIEFALQLCREAGWNQTGDDWRRLVDLEPHGCFVARDQGELAGTITTIQHGNELAWIGMMLVHPLHRRRGVATALMQYSIELLRGRGISCIKLDATPAGELVYSKLGFDIEWEFQRWRRDGNDGGFYFTSLNRQALDVPQLELDRLAFATDRSQLLQLLSHQSVVRSINSSYGMLRSGYLAAYLGPLVADNPQDAERLVAELCCQTESTIFWDIPASNRRAVELARSLGFFPVRDLKRMKLGQLGRQPRIDWQYALADPSVG
jgi:GNAT superfamily N-acetyltransferase